jgi:hypothetical protein
MVMEQATLAVGQRLSGADIGERAVRRERLVKRA